jgi:hypothetical protein
MPDDPQPSAPTEVHSVESVDPNARDAFLLALLASARDRNLKQGELATKLRTKPARALGLNASAVGSDFDSLLTRGFVRVAKIGRANVYELTDTGLAHLDTVRVFVPPVGRGAIVPPTNERIRTLRAEFLLFQVLDAPENGLSDTEANAQLNTYARETLELNAATASHIRRELVRRDLLAWATHNRVIRFSLTTAGRLELGNCSFPERKSKYRLSARALNALLEAAREVGKQFAPVENVPVTTAVTAPAAESVEAAILETFEELLRERHHVTGLVPIHEIRAVIRNRFSEAAAKHDAFDPIVHRLRRTGAFHLLPISNPRDTTSEQLRDSVPGMGETLFYLEAVREPVAH